MRSLNSPRFLPLSALAALALLAAAPLAFAETAAAPPTACEAAWQAILDLEAGPQVAPERLRTRQETQRAAVEHLARQEASLRDYLARFSAKNGAADNNADRTVDAQLRLARVLAVRGDFTGKPELFAAALSLLAEAAAAAPPGRRADLEFARISLVMRRMSTLPNPDKERLLALSNAFLARHPGDRRAAALLAEIATLYDAQPAQKERLLRQALALSPAPDTRARIDDDLRRVALLGTPVPLRGGTPEGREFDVASLRGSIVLVYFFAAWSPPSVAGLAEVEAIRKGFPEAKTGAGGVAVVGVSLDPEPETAAALARQYALPWPILCEPQGWRSPQIRALALNALPTLWALDKQGRLRALNAKADADGLVRRLLKEQGGPAGEGTSP